MAGSDPMDPAKRQASNVDVGTPGFESEILRYVGILLAGGTLMVGCLIFALIVFSGSDGESTRTFMRNLALLVGFPTGCFYWAYRSTEVRFRIRCGDFGDLVGRLSSAKGLGQMRYVIFAVGASVLWFLIVASFARPSDKDGDVSAVLAYGLILAVVGAGVALMIPRGNK
jgi:hypothetical protein